MRRLFEWLLGNTTKGGFYEPYNYTAKSEKFKPNKSEEQE